MDLSEFLKSEYQNLYKMKKSFGDVLNAARKTQNDHRRRTRNMEILSKRGINEENISPYVTPGRKKTPKKKIEKALLNETKADVKSKRFEQFLAWKQEKEKKRQEQKQKAKPMFKVTHVPVTIGLPNLENVNRQIKGKLIAPLCNETYKFAPANHKFKAPSNIKPVPVKVEPVKQATKRFNLNVSNSRRIITRSQKTVLPLLELPSRQRNLNVKKDANAVQKTKKLEVEAEKLFAKNTVRSAKTNKKVALNIQSMTPKSNAKVYKKTPAKIKGDVKSTGSTKRDKRSGRNNFIQTEDAESKSAKESDDYKTPVKCVSLENNKSRQFRGNSRKSRRLSKAEEVITSSDEVQTETCDSPKENRTSEKQRHRNNSVQKDITKPILRVDESKKTERKNINNDHKTQVKFENTKSSRLRGNSRKSKTRQLNEDQEVTADDDTQPCDSLKQVKTNEKRRRGNNSQQPVVKVERIEKKAAPAIRNQQVENEIGKEYNKTPLKSRRASMKSRKSLQSRTSSNENIENIFTTESESCDSPKQTGSSTKQQRKSKKFSSSSPECPVGDVVNSSKSDIDDVNQCFTPRKTVPVAYVSPFVTISRGKSSARKEYFHRKSTGGECDSSPDIRRSTGPQAGAAYFQRILQQEISRIQGLCDNWTNYKETQNPPEEASDMINVAIGQSQLLISKKFKQFQGLIDSCERGDSEVPVTCEDLHGYWDVAYIQVENLDKRFENLENLKRNNWEEILPQANKLQVKKKVGPKRPKGKVTSSLKDAIKAARMKAIFQNPTAQDEDQTKNTTTFDGKFFTITSPHKSPLKKLGEIEPPGRERKSLRAMVLSSQASKRKSAPGWNVIKVSHIAQGVAVDEGLKITPSRSILKGSQSVKKVSKSVLFRDYPRANVNLNETYPPAISNAKPTVLSNITNNDDTQNGRTPKRRSSRNKLF